MWKKGWVFTLACAQDPQVRPTHHLKKLRKNWGQREENITNMRWKIRFRIKICDESICECGMMISIVCVCARLCGCGSGCVFLYLFRAFRLHLVCVFGRHYAPFSVCVCFCAHVFVCCWTIVFVCCWTVVFVCGFAQVCCLCSCVCVLRLCSTLCPIPCPHFPD